MTPSQPSRQPTSLAMLVREARARALETGRRVLVSWSERLEGLDPLAAIEGVLRGADFDGELGEIVRSTLMYWARPRQGFALAGIGAALTIGTAVEAQDAAADRFTSADAEWSSLLASAVVAGAHSAASGPVLMGGFSFDPLRAAEPHWRDFPAASLVLPRLLVGSDHAGSWLTTSVVVQADGTTDVDTAGLARLQAQVAGMAREGRGAAPTADIGDVELVTTEPVPADAWRALVAQAVRDIEATALEKVVLARAVRIGTGREVDPVAALRHLHDAQPDAQSFAVWRGESVFLGASPERLVQLEGDAVSASSLAGSAPRGSTVAEDDALAAGLLASTKDRAEHAFVRRMLCDALAESCDDVQALPEPSLLTLANVHHLHTNVTGRLRAGGTLLQLVGRVHPTPAVGGEPRDEALRWIREHEGMDRGWYAAPVGWVGRDAGEFAVALRSGLFRGSEAWLFAGCGVVAGSDPDAEYEESVTKLRAMRAAVERAAAAALPAPAGRSAR